VASRCTKPRRLACKLEPAGQTFPTEALIPIAGPDSAAHLARALIGDQARENYIALYLSAKNCIVAYDVFTTGELNAVSINPSVVVRGAVMVGAVSVVTAHNHPSGNAVPSAEDLAVYREITKRLSCLGIRHLDDLIITVDDWYAGTTGNVASF
jgi:DNA repair protein RadC